MQRLSGNAPKEEGNSLRRERSNFSDEIDDFIVADDLVKKVSNKRPGKARQKILKSPARDATESDDDEENVPLTRRLKKR